MSAPDPDGTASLSARGQAMVNGGLADYIAAHIRLKHDEGYVGLSVAENHGVFDLLQPKLDNPPPVPAHVTGYDDFSGKQDLREGIATLFSNHIFDRPVDPAHVQVLAGAGGVLDAVGHALADPGDGVLVPTPSYAGFWPDFEVRPGLQMVPVHTAAADGFRLTPELLDSAVNHATCPVRILLLTNPDNPRGQIMNAVDLQVILDWADRRDIHVIADEIYALSAYGPRTFTSVGALRPDLGQRLHVVWAFSKDFGMSGLRCGVLISQNEALRATVELQGTWSGVSGHTQHILAGMLADDEWVEGFITTMRDRLREASQTTTKALADAGIPYLPPEAGFFVLCDLRGFLDAPTWEAEQQLWDRVLQQTQVNLTPGSACHIAEPGFFRLCFAANPPDVVADAIGRVGRALSAATR